MQWVWKWPGDGAPQVALMYLLAGGWALDQQHQRHLGPWEKCNIGGPSPELLNQGPRDQSAGSDLCLHKPSQGILMLTQVRDPRPWREFVTC